MEFTHYYGKHKRRNTVVRQIVVRQPVKVSFWLDGESYEELESMTKEIGNLSSRKPNISKTMQDITHDYLLDQKLQRQKYELEGI